MHSSDDLERLAGIESRWNLIATRDDPPQLFLYPTDGLPDLLRTGVPPAAMLLDDWLYEGELHWIYAEAEAFKTWVALILALEVMKQGHRVVWFDEELGERAIARRLLSLGADPGLIEERFAYFPFPGMSMEQEDVLKHAETVGAIKPALVVYDTATDMLTAAGADENSGREVTQWVKAFPEVVRQLGFTQIVLDHTAKGGDTAVGSRAKRAKAKVQYFFVSEERADVSTVGRLRVTLTKNTPGNALPQVRIFKIGGDGKGGFVFELAETRASSSPSAIKAGKRQAVREDIETVLEERGELNQTQLTGLVGAASKNVVIEVAKEMASESTVSGVEAVPEGRSLKYRWVGKPEVPGPAPAAPAPYVDPNA